MDHRHIDPDRHTLDNAPPGFVRKTTDQLVKNRTGRAPSIARPAHCVATTQRVDVTIVSGRCATTLHSSTGQVWSHRSICTLTLRRGYSASIALERLHILRTWLLMCVSGVMRRGGTSGARLLRERPTLVPVSRQIYYTLYAQPFEIMSRLMNNFRRQERAGSIKL